MKSTEGSKVEVHGQAVPGAPSTSSGFADLEIVVIRPLPGAHGELLALRPVVIGEYRAAFGDRFDAVLSQETDDRWVDVWMWVDREDAEAALASRALIPSFERWEALVELVSVTWATIIA